MNPIKEIWAQMKSNIYRHNPLPTNVTKLQAALQGEWDAVAPEEIHPMLRRIAPLLEHIGLRFFSLIIALYSVLKLAVFVPLSLSV